MTLLLVQNSAHDGVAFYYSVVFTVAEEWAGLSKEGVDSHAKMRVVVLGVPGRGGGKDG
jgi:hypothetical protein